MNRILLETINKKNSVFNCFNFAFSMYAPVNVSSLIIANSNADKAFSDFPDFRKMLIWGISHGILGSGKVCNRLEMAVGFKSTNSQLTSNHIGLF